MPFNVNTVLDGLFCKNLLFEFALSVANATAPPEVEPLCMFNACYNYLLQELLPTQNNSKHQLSISVVFNTNITFDGLLCKFTLVTFRKIWVYLN